MGPPTLSGAWPLVEALPRQQFFFSRCAKFAAYRPAPLSTSPNNSRIVIGGSAKAGEDFAPCAPISWTGEQCRTIITANAADKTGGSVELDQDDLWTCADAHRRTPSPSAARCIDHEFTKPLQPVSVITEDASGEPGEGKYLASVGVT